MDSRLENMTLEELWELFPIFLVPHDFRWADLSKEEIRLLNSLLSSFNPVINHIGSTAIPDIQAKPIIDILVEVSPVYNLLNIKRILETNGYICMSEGCGRLSFNKGYTPKGYDEKVFHIHIHRLGDNDEICFRDYLTEHSDVAKDYELLKLSLITEFRNNRDAYTEAKTEFIRKVVGLAKLNNDVI